MRLVPIQSKFPLGQIVITPNAMSRISQGEIDDGLLRHARGDWGNICPEDAGQNNQALQCVDRVLTVYGAGSQRFWIITEADRSVTTILMPEDY